MPRFARTVFVGVPHHITQRGNRREDVLYVEEDYLTYLEWLSHYSQKLQLEVLAYCLMTNHIDQVNPLPEGEGVIGRMADRPGF